MWAKNWLCNNKIRQKKRLDKDGLIKSSSKSGHNFNSNNAIDTKIRLKMQIKGWCPLSCEACKRFFLNRFLLKKDYVIKKLRANKKKLKEVQLFSTVTSNSTNGSASFFRLTNNVEMFRAKVDTGLYNFEKTINIF